MKFEVKKFRPRSFFPFVFFSTLLTACTSGDDSSGPSVDVTPPPRSLTTFSGALVLQSRPLSSQVVSVVDGTTRQDRAIFTDLMTRSYFPTATDDGQLFTWLAWTENGVDPGRYDAVLMSPSGIERSRWPLVFAPLSSLEISPDGERGAIVEADYQVNAESEQPYFLHLYTVTGESIQQLKLPELENHMWRLGDLPAPSIKWRSDEALLVAWGSALYQLDLSQIDSVEWVVLHQFEGSLHGMDLSPDGVDIVAGVQTEDAGIEIVKLNLNSLNSERLTASDMALFAPTWSPGGDQIAVRADLTVAGCRFQTEGYLSCFDSCSDVLIMSSDVREEPITLADLPASVLALRKQGRYGESPVCSETALQWVAQVLPSENPGTPLNKSLVNGGLGGRFIITSESGDSAIRNAEVATGVESFTSFGLYEGNGEVVFSQCDTAGNWRVSEWSERGEWVYSDGEPVDLTDMERLIPEIKETTIDTADYETIVVSDAAGQVLSQFTYPYHNRTQRPKISPDGNVIAVSDPRVQMTGGQAAVSLITPDGSFLPDQQLLAPDSSGWDGYNWFNDGQLLLHKGNQIFQYNPLTQTRSLLATLPQEISTVTPSPSGTQLAFVMRGHIWVSDSDGSDLRQLTDSAWKEESPQWSPTGEAIAFLHDSEVMAVPADAERVYVGFGSNVSPAVIGIQSYNTGSELSPILATGSFTREPFFWCAN